jgi:hypothetical protein
MVRVVDAKCKQGLFIEQMLVNRQVCLEMGLELCVKGKDEPV